MSIAGHCSFVALCFSNTTVSGITVGYQQHRFVVWFQYYYLVQLIVSIKKKLFKVAKIHHTAHPRTITEIYPEEGSAIKTVPKISIYS